MAELLANELMKQAEQNTANEQYANAAQFLIDKGISLENIESTIEKIKKIKGENISKINLDKSLIELYTEYGAAGFTNKTIEKIKAESEDDYKPPFEIQLLGDIIDDESLQPPRMIIKDLLTPGLTIFAAPPKSGKSYMCMQMAQQIANGEEFFFRRTEKTKILYLALEDSKTRLKKRGKEILGSGKSGKDIPGVYTTTVAVTLKNGLIKALQYYVDTVGIKMFIIDTMGTVEDDSKKSQEYAAVYKELRDIQSFALNNDAAVILIHHTKKASDYQSENPFDAILGSTAIAGVADTMWVLSKKRNGDATLFVTGRDVETQELSIRWDSDFYTWGYMGNAEEQERQRQKALFEKDPLTIAIKNMLETGKGYFDMTSKELVEYADVRRSYTSAGIWIRNNIDFFEDMGIKVEPPTDTTTSKREHDGKSRSARLYKFTKL